MFGNAKARRELWRRTKRQLGVDDASGRAASVNAPYAPRQPSSMHAHATGREVDGEALRGQGEPRRPGVFGIATAWCNWVGSATSCWGRLHHGVRIKVNLKPTIK